MVSIDRKAGHDHQPHRSDFTDEDKARAYKLFVRLAWHLERAPYRLSGSLFGFLVR
jgi:hypothetical protein